MKKEINKKIRKCAFIVNIEESVREASVPNLPGVHSRRRFFLLSCTLITLDILQKEIGRSYLHDRNGSHTGYM